MNFPLSSVAQERALNLSTAPTALDLGRRPTPFDQPFNISPASSSSGTPSTVAFVDGSLDDYQTLVAALQPVIEVVILNSAASGLQQVQDYLAGRSNIASLQIFSHGESGEFQLGSDLITTANANLLQSWAGSLTEDADILLYGCNVAQGELGQAFVQILSQVTGADIAASNDLTGSANLGGNWVLEYQAGEIATELGLNSNLLSSYDSILPVALPGYTETVYVSGLPTAPSGITIDSATRTLYVADQNTLSTLRKIAPDKTVSTVATFGSANSNSGSNFYPYVATDIEFSGGFVYSSLGAGGLIQIDTTTGATSTLTTFTNFAYESGLVANGNSLYVTSGTSNSRTLWEYNLSTNTSTLRVSGLPASPSSLEYNAVSNRYFLAAYNGGFYTVDPVAGTFSTITTNSLGSVGNFAVDPTGEYLYVRVGSNISRVSTTNGAVTTFATGLVNNSYSDLVFGTASSGTGTSLYVANGTSILEYSTFNVAPVLDNSGNPTLPTLPYNSTSSTGTTIGQLITQLGGTGITDPNPGASRGIAVTAVDNSNGRWQYSTDSGATWTNFGTVSGNNARLLADVSTNQIRFVPNAGFSGTVTSGISFRAWDQTSGTSGGTADTTVNGSSTAFSINVETADVTIDLPSIYNFSTATYSALEGDTTNATNIVTINRTGGTLFASSVDVVVAAGTAIAGSDFTAQTVTINFTAGQSTVTLPIQIIGDTLNELDETVLLSFTNPSTGSQIGTSISTTTLTIVNDDPTAVVIVPPAEVVVVTTAPPSIFKTSKKGKSGIKIKVKKRKFRRKK